jgi:multiple sugar transport system permease protein
MISRRTKTKMENVAIYFVSALIAFIILFPIYWMICTSLKPRILIFSNVPVLFFKPTLDAYKFLFTGSEDFGLYMKNSAIVATGSASLSLLLGSLAGYAIARFRFKGRDNIAFWILTQRMMPPIAIAIPLFILWGKIGLSDTLIGLIIAHTAFNVPFAVFSMGSYFQEIPKEVDEQAMVDGVTRLGAFLRIALPLAAPGVIATVILLFILSWNEFLMGLVLTGMNARPATVGTTVFLPTSARETMWAESSAAGVLLMAPVLAFALLLRKYLVRGLTLGAVRG